MNAVLRQNGQSRQMAYEPLAEGVTGRYSASIPVNWGLAKPVRTEGA